MRKSFALTLVSLAIALSAQAIRPIHKAFPVKQPDGTSVMLYKNGDGHLAFYTTEDNQVVVRDANGTLCYAKLVGTELVATSVVCHDISNRTADEIAFVSSNTLKPTDQALAKLAAPLPRLAAPMKASGASTSDGLGKYGTSANGAVPTIGSPKIPVIMVEYADTKFQEGMTEDKLSRMLNEEGYHEDNNLERGSVLDYFKAQSRGMFTPEFKVVAKVTLSQGYAYYGQNTGGHGTGDKNAIAMVREAVSAAVTQGVNFDEFKINNKIPNVIVYYAGCGEATGGDDNTIWPHELDLPLSYGNMSGHLFSSYFVGNELYGTSESNMPMGIGVLVHEFGHAMGLPDFYDPTYSYSDDSSFGYWSVMDQGAYVSNSYAPAGYNAYERSFMGWLDIKELSEPGLVTLASPENTDGDMAVMFRNPKDNNEYFIMENRQPGTWYPESWGSGLLLTRIAFNASAWTYNSVNTNQLKKRAMVVTANANPITDVNLANQYQLFGNGNNRKESYEYFTGLAETGNPVYNVMKQPDGTVTFSFKQKGFRPEPIVGEGVYQKVTDASTLTSNDVVIFVNETDGVAMSSGKQVLFTSTYTKFDGDKMYGNDDVQEFTLTKSSNKWFLRLVATGNPYLCAGTMGLSTATRPDANCFASIAINDGNADVEFVNTKNVDKVMNYYSTDCYFYNSGSAEGTFQIYRKVATDGISNVVSDGTKLADGKMYNLAGQLVGDDYKGIVIQNGKKWLKK